MFVATRKAKNDDSSDNNNPLINTKINTRINNTELDTGSRVLKSLGL